MARFDAIMGSGSWTRPHPGPLARAAVEAVGAPFFVAELRIHMSGIATGNQLSVNGHPVSRRDATLVMSAAACDPHPVQPGPPLRDIEYIRRAIIIRNLLNVGGVEA